MELSDNGVLLIVLFMKDEEYPFFVRFCRFVDFVRFFQYFSEQLYYAFCLISVFMIPEFAIY